MGNLLFGERYTEEEKRTLILRMLYERIQGLKSETRRKEREDRKLIASMKDAAQRGQNVLVRQIARRIATLRTIKERFYLLEERFESLRTRIELIRVNESMFEGFTSTISMLKNVNLKMPMDKLKGNIHLFEKEVSKLDIKEDDIGDTLDNQYETSETSEKEEAMVNAIIDDAGITLREKMQGLGVPSSLGGGEISELELRLMELQKK